MNELFRMNEYGDTWQEPELFDQLEQGDDVTSGNSWPYVRDEVDA